MDKPLNKPVLSIPEIAKLCKRSRMWGWNHRRDIDMVAKRVPGYTQGRYYNSKRLRKWIDEQKQLKEKEKTASRAPRSVGQRRAEEIKKIEDILNDQMEVSAEDKKLALEYFNCLDVLWMARHGLFFWRQFPLLEGLHALYQSKLIFGHGLKIDVWGLESAIKRLPTRSETTPQTEQSFSNVSD
jgi:hypothetical protein